MGLPPFDTLGLTAVGSFDLLKRLELFTILFAFSFSKFSFSLLKRENLELIVRGLAFCSVVDGSFVSKETGSIFCSLLGETLETNSIFCSEVFCKCFVCIGLSEESRGSGSLVIEEADPDE